MTILDIGFGIIEYYTTNKADLVNNHYLTDYSLFFWFYMSIKEFHVMYYFHLKNEVWVCPQRTLLMNLIHQSSFLSSTQWWPHWLELYDSRYEFKALVFSRCQRCLVGLPYFSELLWYVMQLKTPLLMLKCAIVSFPFPFLYQPLYCLLLNCLNFTFKEIIICKLLHISPFPSSSSFTKHGFRFLR